MITVTGPAVGSTAASIQMPRSHHFGCDPLLKVTSPDQTGGNMMKPGRRGNMTRDDEARLEPGGNMMKPGLSRAET